MPMPLHPPTKTPEVDTESPCKPRVLDMIAAGIAVGATTPQDGAALLARAGAEIAARRESDIARRPALDARSFVPTVRALIAVAEAAQALRPHLSLIAEALDDARASARPDEKPEICAAGDALDALQRAAEAL